MNTVHPSIRFSAVRKYATYFRIRFTSGLQYRAAAAAGIATQFAWGFLTVLLYKAFWDADPASFPMGIAQVTSYMWLRQAFLALFNSWTVDNTILADITGGGIAYELIRPMNLYALWFTKNISMRAANAVLRFLPILLVASFLPAPWGMCLPAGIPGVLGFLATMFLGALVTCAIVMFIYIFTCFTMQPLGVRMVCNAVTDFCSGNLVPLPFFPPALAAILEFTPFAAMQNIPFRIYSGHIAGWDILRCMGLQLFWLAVLVLLGGLLMKKALKRVAIQGG
ncbi:MAG: ABC transporter permease [Clostridia bacterium]|nr:ABC transporter permease [Clostridia bacterium]